MEEGGSVVDASTCNSSNTALQHPWPHLKQLFAVKAKKGNCVIMSCQLCLPRPVEILAFKSSSSNLKKHIERKHPSKLKQYKECVLKRKNSEEQRCDSAVKQMKIKDYSMSCRQVTQSTIDRLVVEFVWESLQPFTIVELPTFKNLIHTMQPSCTVMSRPTVKLRIEEAAAKVKKNIAEMAKVSYIDTTTDCWTARQRSYIGVTAHWIDESTLERRSASIAFRRLKGSIHLICLQGVMWLGDKMFKSVAPALLVREDNIYGMKGAKCGDGSKDSA
ncbi:uncharacterized protein LOC113524717 [Pangasianodon hypophthalmus]|uniref:uncharacterized protein LOC113524717 n=1 Tax=Pangasianodon hypophthalmus TaxID=310915 RepID=UPI0023071C88|nr:uncharacterized protein LOC113524717 [Pangasianodon hypophthalmus]